MTIFCLVSFTTGAVRSAMPASAGFLVSNDSHSLLASLLHYGNEYTTITASKENHKNLFLAATTNQQVVMSMCVHMFSQRWMKWNQMHTMWDMFLEDITSDKLLKPLCVEARLMNWYRVLHTANGHNLSRNMWWSAFTAVTVTCSGRLVMSPQWLYCGVRHCRHHRRL